MKTNKLILFVIITGILAVHSCEPDKKMLVETGDVSNISTTTVDVSGTVIDVGEGATQHGHCYNTSGSPAVSGTKTALGMAAKGDFTSSLTGLEPSTTYYVRAYTSLGGETAYGSEITFITASAALPELTTTTITSITKTSAVTGGIITSEGGTPVTARGVCWNVATGPTTANSKTTDGAGTGNFASSITGLTANTKYYVRAYSTNSGGTAYGNEISFTTSPEVAVAPTVTTAEVTSVTSNSAVSGGDVTNEGGAPVTAKGVCWSTTANPTITNSKTNDGTGSGSFVSNLINLNPGTTYYARAYATNSAGTSYGNEYSFKTIVVVPTLTTVEVSAITNTTASSGGSITSDGGAPVTARGVCWSTSQNPTTADNKTNDGLGSGLFTSNLTNLTGNTTYYIRAYATNSAGTAYGDELSFKAGAVVPSLTTAAVTSITSTTATSGGEISSDGGSSVTAKGVCWNTSANPTTADTKTSDGTGTGSFTSSITGLTPGETYHVRAYATNTAGTGYGEDLAFTTIAVVPTVETAAITNITTTTATSGGTITSDGGADITARGVCWSTSANPTTTNEKTSDGTGTGSFASSITGLTPGTSYHVRAYAINSIGTAYGEDLTFTAGAAIATVTTASISDITSTTATSGGNVTSDGGSSVTARGVCWSTSTNPTTGDSKTSDASGTGLFVSSITGLIPCTTYHVRAYATNSAGTAYGDDISFISGTVLPTVTTTSITDITSAAASSGGNISGSCASTVTAKGVCWSTAANPTTADSKTSDGTGGGSYISSITGLTPGATYHVRAYAINSVGTAYGEDLTFTAGAVLATITTIAVTDITSTTATSGGNITSDGGSSVTAKGVCWSTSHNPTTDHEYTNDGIGTGSFTSSIIGLAPNTTYYVRAYATNSAGTAYASNELDFKTNAALPTLTTIAINSITDVSAISGGDITDDGGASITARGVCWNTSSGPTIDNSKTNNGVGAGVFPSDITGLTPNTDYWVRAYATNSAGTVYGNELQLKTLCTAPTATTNAASGIGSATATLNGTVNANGFSTTVIFEYGLTTSYGSTATASPSIVTGNGNTDIVAGLTGLSSNTLYHYRIKAENCSPTPIYSNDMTFTTLAIVTTTPMSNITTTSASSGGSIDVGGGANIINRGVCWNTSPNPTIAHNKTTDGTVTGSYTSSLTGLISNTIYYVRSYVTNDGGTNYSNSDIIFSSLAFLTTTSISSITNYTALGGGNIETGGGTGIDARGVCWNINPNPTIAHNHSVDGSGPGIFTSNLTGLSAGTIYYVRAYATNSYGTSYGNQVCFSTSFTKSYNAGDVAPVSKTITYGTIPTSLSGENKLWITKNLGADNQAVSATDATEAAAGWYWQFNRKQGYKHDGTTRTPATTWISSISEASDWTASNDPCTILLGTGWRIPSQTEWNNADNSTGWNNYNDTYASVLKLHAAGNLNSSDGALGYRGTWGYYWSSVQSSNTYGRTLFLDSNTSSATIVGPKQAGFSVRCIKD